MGLNKLHTLWARPELHTHHVPARGLMDLYYRVIAVEEKDRLTVLVFCYNPASK
jgi:hypothetical protein